MKTYLEASKHPDKHPHATLDLIDALVDPNQPRFGENDLRSIIERVRDAEAVIAESAIFRIWNERLRIQNL
ncbi:hypothetical protein ACD578_29805 (plasmid) [Microvirga sp. RSM25]|uniref:hypothetical protein n=1 Tax=Microvirga sp. RSM25 TaxID=3273802 RepID=UPI00384DAF86